MGLAFCCGWECSNKAPGNGVIGTRHWDATSGTTAIETGIVKYGTKALRVTGAAAAANLRKTISQTTVVARMYFYIVDAPAAADMILFSLSPDVGSPAEIHWHGVSGNIRAAVGTTRSTGPNISFNTWYQLDVKIICNGTNVTIDWAIDGVANSQVNAAQATTLFNQATVGWFSASTGDVIYDEFAMSWTGGDYPLGNGKVIALLPVSDGTHSFTLGDFKYDNSTNVPTSATDVYTKLNQASIESATGFISQNVINANGYIEVVFATTPEAINARGVEVVSASLAAGPSINAATLKLNDGGTLSDIYTNLDVSFTSNIYHTLQFAAPPSGGAWTPSKLTGLKARWGYSGDVSDVPYFAGILLEVEYPVVGLVMYPKDAAAPSSNMGEMQVGGAAPAGAVTGTGWTVGVTAAGNYARMDYGVERTSASFGATAQPNSGPDNTLGDCFRTTNPLSGTFAAGNWDVSFMVRAVTAAGGQDGRLRIRIWKSANADGSSPTEITAGAVQLSIVTNLAVGVDQASSGNISLGSVVLNSEYLFFQLAWEITGAAA